MFKKETLFNGVVFIKQTSVVQVFLYPVFNVFEFSKIDDKSVIIRLCTGEARMDRPVMSVQIGAMPVVSVLAVREGMSR